MRRGTFTFLLASLFLFGYSLRLSAQIQCDSAAAFVYNATDFCQNGADPIITISGAAGFFSYQALSGGPTLSLNANSGDVNLANSDPGSYRITNTIQGGGGGGDLALTGVIDGPLSGGQPKAVELYAQVAIPNLSIYSIRIAANGNPAFGAATYTFPAVAVAAGTHIWVANQAAPFQTFFGFPPTYASTVISFNGDDVVGLFKNGLLHDVFGELGVDGTGTPWDYEDGWAYRFNQSGPDGSTFVLANWFFSGANALDFATSNMNANPPFPIQTYSFSATGQSSSCSADINIQAQPDSDGGPNQVVCGAGPVSLNAVGQGTWSGGAGVFNDVNSPTAAYTPAVSEIGTTVVLSWTVPGAFPCTNASDDVLITILPEPDAEFSYGGDQFCPNEGLINTTHTTGSDGLYTYSVVSGGPTLAINAQTGQINTLASDRGTYQVTNTVGGCGSLVITGIVDGNLPGGLPKAVEFTAIAPIPNLSIYGFGSANNGGGTDGIEFTFPAISVAAGTHIWVATESTTFNNFFGFPPTFVSTFAASINGDDAIELFCDGQPMDIFGNINQSGFGQPWEYTDGWAYRANNTGPDGIEFQLQNWFFSGPNALDPATSNANANPPVPFGTFTSNAGPVCPDDVFTQTITIDDTEAPVLSCPANIIVNLDPGLCEAIVNFTVTATDNCDPNPVVSIVDGCDCSNFEIGVHELEYQASDIYGNVSTCVFSITVLEYPNPIQTLTCNDLVQISLDPFGQAVIGADDILEGGPYGCYDNYIVNILNSFGFPIGNVADCSHIGPTWMVEVVDPATGNKCWGAIVVEDKLPPTVLCNEVQIACTVDYNNVPFPLAFDNCDFIVDVQLISQTINDGLLCEEGFVTVIRTFIGVDDYGNQSAPCSQIITILRPTSVTFPADVQWECSEYAQYPNITGATPLTGSLPTTGSGVPAGLDGQYCQFGYIHADEIIDACGDGFKIVRNWTALDWCNGSVITGIQIIKVVDSTPPVITLAPFTVEANITGTHPQPCKSTGLLLPPVVTDNCSDWTVRIFTPVGEAVYVNGSDGAQGGYIPAPGLELGTHLIQYIAEDECNNVAELYVSVTVVDGIVPTAICDEITEVNLSSDGLAVMPASVLDDGSFDNCCLDGFAVRRMDGDCNGDFDDFGPTVTFCCVDAGQAITVIFRAYDCFGNFNDCMVTVNVNDKVPPSLLFCPQNQTITCDDYLQNYAPGVATGDYSVLEGFGTPVFYDNCSLTITENVTVNLNTCQQGTIIRSWQASDGVNAPANCTQTITVTHVNNWEVLFPADITANCVNGQLPGIGEPQIFFDECELIAVSHEDQIFTVVPDACYKIVRTWTVINWCIYNPAGNNTTTDDVLVAPRRYRSGPDGWVQYQQTIKVIDTEAPNFTVPAIDGCILSTSCTKTLVLPYPDIDDACSIDFVVSISGDFGDFNDIAGAVSIPNVGIGEYEITYAVTDNCGNTKYETIIVEVEDCKLPTPYCKNGLVVEIMQTGMIELFASQLDAGSFDNCGPVSLSFFPDVSLTSIIFTCDNLGQQVVTLWVTDQSGNKDFCETFVVVQDNMNACNAVTVALGGAIATEENKAINNVTVEVNGGTFTTFTNVQGEYSLNVPEGNDYTIAPIHDVTPSNGVTTWDLVLISRHILGVQPLTSPYKIIAADANRNNAVTTLDMVAIRKVILQLEPEFPNNTSWRFVDKNFVFPNSNDPFQTPFPEVVNFNNLYFDQLFVDFVAVKVGDVNGSASGNFADDETEERSFEGSLTIQTEEMELRAGETYRLSFRAPKAAIFGYQFTLNFDRQTLAFEDIIPALAGAEHFGLALLDEGAITASWNGPNAVELTEGEQLFTLVFQARRNALLSQALTLDSRFTAAEAYNSQGSRLNVSLGFSGQMEKANFTLYQNTPNPFSGVTNIGFHLPEPAPVSVTVMDMSGKVIKLVRGDFGQGYNEVQIDDLKTSGVYYYRVDTPEFTATRKMVVQ